MNCFKHPETPSVGICKFCQKGLCQECVHDLGHGLACREHLREVNDLQTVFLAQSPSFKKITGTSWGYVFIVLGIYLSATALMEMLETSTKFSWMGLGLGVIFVSVGVYLARMQFFNYKNYKR